jgi:hypothetical protein
VLRYQVPERQPAAAPLQDHRRRGGLFRRPAADDLADQLDREALVNGRWPDRQRAAQHDMLADRLGPLPDGAAELDAAIAADQLAEQVAGIALGPGAQALDPALDQDLAGRPLDPDLVEQRLDDQRHGARRRLRRLRRCPLRPFIGRLPVEQVGHRDRPDPAGLSSSACRPGAWR